MAQRKRPYIVTCESGADWLVLATSTEEALAAWPEDAETARTARLASREDAEWCHGRGCSDLDEDDFAEVLRGLRR